MWNVILMLVTNIWVVWYDIDDYFFKKNISLPPLGVMIESKKWLFKESENIFIGCTYLYGLDNGPNKKCSNIYLFRKL